MAHDVYSTPYVCFYDSDALDQNQGTNFYQIKSGRPFHIFAMFETLCHAIIPWWIMNIYEHLQHKST